MQTIDNERFRDAKECLRRKHYLTSDAAFAERVGCQRSYISELVNNKRSLTDHFIDQLTTTFPELSRTWLMTGEGEMLTGPAPAPSPTENERLEEARQALGLSQTEMARGLDIKQGSLSDILRGKPGVGVSNKIKDALEKNYSINIDWLRTGRGAMFLDKGNATAVDPSLMNWISVPVVPYSAMAGTGGEWGDLFTDEGVERKRVLAPEGARPQDYAVFTVVGDSMIPQLQEHDEVLAKLVPLPYYKDMRLHIYAYKVWVIITRHSGILVKNLTAHDVERHTITCHSFNPSYTDFVVDLEEVRAIYHAVSLMRSFVG